MMATGPYVSVNGQQSNVAVISGSLACQGARIGRQVLVTPLAIGSQHRISGDHVVGTGRVIVSTLAR